MPLSHRGLARLVETLPAGGATYADKVLGYSPIAYWTLAEDAADSSGNGYDGTASSVTYGSDGPDGGGHGVFNGTSSYIDVYGAGLASAFDPNLLTVSFWMRVSGAGVWTDSTNRTMFKLREDGFNELYFRKSSTDNTLFFTYTQNGTAKLVSTTSLGGETGWHHLAMTATVAGDEMKVFIDGAQVDSTQTGLGSGAWTTLNSVASVIGARNTTPSFLFSGDLAHCAVFDYVLTPAQVADLATV